MKKFKIKNKNNGLARSLSKGFSLIELLVVIAILIAMSAIVLVRLDSVRDEVVDTVVKANLESIRAQAKNYFFRNGNYGTATVAITGSYPGSSTFANCSTAGTFLAVPAVATYLSDAESQIDNTNNWVAVCGVGKLAGETNATSWAVGLPLRSGGYWCVSNLEEGVPTDNIWGGGASASAGCNYVAQ